MVSFALCVGLKAGEPRTGKMPVDQDWTAVYPSAAPFRPGSVPLPVRMGYPVKGGIPPEKKGNLELIKVRPHYFQHAHRGPKENNIFSSDKVINMHKVWINLIKNDRTNGFVMNWMIIYTTFSHTRLTLGCIWMYSLYLWWFELIEVGECSCSSSWALFALLHGFSRCISVPGLLSCYVQTPAALSGLKPLADPLVSPITAGYLQHNNIDFILSAHHEELNCCMSLGYAWWFVFFFLF